MWKPLYGQAASPKIDRDRRTPIPARPAEILALRARRAPLSARRGRSLWPRRSSSPEPPWENTLTAAERGDKDPISTWARGRETGCPGRFLRHPKLFRRNLYIHWKIYLPSEPICGILTLYPKFLAWDECGRVRKAARPFPAANKKGRLIYEKGTSFSVSAKHALQHAPLGAGSGSAAGWRPHSD